MKRTVFLFVLLLFAISNYAQTENKEKIKISAEQLKPEDLLPNNTDNSGQNSSGSNYSAKDFMSKEKSNNNIFHFKPGTGEMETSGPDNFKVYNYEGKSASELYKNVISAISLLYKNPDKVLSKVDNVSITVSATALDVKVPRKKSSINDVFPQKYDYYAFDYTLSFLFKEGKIRVDAPFLDSKSILFANPIDGGLYSSVASRFVYHLGIRNDDINISFENYMNELITTILKKSETVNNW